MKPLLAGKAVMELVQFPVLASPKIDGVRAMIIDGVVMSRNGKPIPNREVQKRFGRKGLNGLDGELVHGDIRAPNAFNETQSVVMSEAQDATRVGFYVFDYFGESLLEPFVDRLARARKFSSLPFGIFAIHHERMESAAQLEGYETACLRQGYEGVMLRHPFGRYKQGRSTTKEGILLKLKRFEHGEARVIGFEELQHNENEKDASGRRTSHKAGKRGGATLGNVIVKDLVSGVEFGIGSGFTEAQRLEIWRNRDVYADKIARYKYFPTGSVERPRFPVFAGWRDPIDL